MGCSLSFFVIYYLITYISGKLPAENIEVL